MDRGVPMTTVILIFLAANAGALIAVALALRSLSQMLLSFVLAMQAQSALLDTISNEIGRAYEQRNGN
jgi:uncharacterized membrane protein